MRKVEELLAKINSITAEFAEMAANGVSSITDLTDEDLAEVVGDRAHESAVAAHRIVGKLREAASQLEVMAYTLNRRSSHEQCLPDASSQMGNPSATGNPRISLNTAHAGDAVSSGNRRKGARRSRNGDLN